MYKITTIFLLLFFLFYLDYWHCNMVYIMLRSIWTWNDCQQWTMMTSIMFLYMYIDVYIQFRRLIARLPGAPYRFVFSGREVLHPRGLRGCSFEISGLGSRAMFFSPSQLSTCSAGGILLAAIPASTSIFMRLLVWSHFGVCLEVCVSLAPKVYFARVVLGRLG